MTMTSWGPPPAMSSPGFETRPPRSTRPPGVLNAPASAPELLSAAIPVPGRARGPIAARPLLRQLALWPFLGAPRRCSPRDARLLIDGTGAPGVLPVARAIRGASGWARIPVHVPVALISGDRDLIAPLSDLRTFPG